MDAIPYYTGHAMPIRYWAAYRFLLGGPKPWKRVLHNLLFASLCILIPMVGPIVLTGWLIEVLVPRLNEDWPGWTGSGDYPDFTFERFTKYLMRGLWPFLVNLVAGLVLMLPLMVLMFGTMICLPFLARGNGTTVLVVVASAIVVCAGVAMVASIVIVPLMLRAALLQDFGMAFSWAWTKDFLRIMWRELAVCTVFMMVTAVPLVALGYAAFFVGTYAAMALIAIAQWHLHFQAYRLYVARGGSPIPAKGFPPPFPT